MGGGAPNKWEKKIREVMGEPCRFFGNGKKEQGEEGVKERANTE